MHDKDESFGIYNFFIQFYLLYLIYFNFTLSFEDQCYIRMYKYFDVVSNETNHLCVFYLLHFFQLPVYFSNFEINHGLR